MNITKVEQRRFVFINFSLLTKKLLDILVLSTVFTAIVGASIISFSYLLYLNKIPIDMVIATSLTTYSVYSLNRVTDIEEDETNLPERVDFIRERKNTVIFLSIFAYALALIIGIFRNIETVPVFLIPFIAGAIYSIKIRSFRVKDLLAMKNLTVSFSWSLSSSLLPFIFYRNIKMFIMLFSFLFLKVFVNTIVFDVRDVEGDRMAGTRTIPVVIGRSNTKKLLMILNTFLLILAFLSFKMGFFSEYLPVMLFSVFYGYWYILKFCKNEKNNKYYFDYLVDGEFIFLAILSLSIHFLSRYHA